MIYLYTGNTFNKGLMLGLLVSFLMAILRCASPRPGTAVCVLSTNLQHTHGDKGGLISKVTRAESNHKGSPVISHTNSYLP